MRLQKTDSVMINECFAIAYPEVLRNGGAGPENDHRVCRTL